MRRAGAPVLWKSLPGRLYRHRSQGNCRGDFSAGFNKPLQGLSIDGERGTGVNELAVRLRQVFPASLKCATRNYMAAAALLGLAYGIYQIHPYYQSWLSHVHFWHFFTVSDQEVFKGLLVIYLAVLPLFYLTLPDSHPPKSILFWRAVVHAPRRRMTESERVAVLAVMVKFIFVPLMWVWLLQHGASIIASFKDVLHHDQFFPNGYWLLLHLIMFVDVLFFTIGYCVEHPALGNEIRSVEPTVLGWMVTLLCYPPFNQFTDTMLGWYSKEYPEVDSLWLQSLLAAGILTSMTIYAWASVALNLKASNLTHRGIVAHGPYAFVRHPAYVAKNIAWWIGALPVLGAALQDSLQELVRALASLSAWSFLYYLRAVTEERHLSRDPAYLDYCRRVPDRFIPRWR